MNKSSCNRDRKRSEEWVGPGILIGLNMQWRILIFLVLLCFYPPAGVGGSFREGCFRCRWRVNFYSGVLENCHACNCNAEKKWSFLLLPSCVVCCHSWKWKHKLHLKSVQNCPYFPLFFSPSYFAHTVEGASVNTAVHDLVMKWDPTGNWIGRVCLSTLWATFDEERQMHCVCACVHA